MNVGIVGCGVISNVYAPRLQQFDDVAVVACADLDRARADASAAKHGIPRSCTVDELLADPAVDIVVNLTTPAAHHEVGIAVLEAGKSLYSEKPLTLTREGGQSLLDEATGRDLKLGCAPDTFLGAGAQTARKVIDDGAIGTPIGGVAVQLCPGHERWHPNPDFYYQRGGGPLFDLGPYALTTLVSLLGPVRRVSGSARITYPERVIMSEPRRGEKIPVDVPTHVSGVLDFESGAMVTLITSFDVWGHQIPSIEIYGSDGTLHVPDPNGFGGPVRLLRPGSEWEELPHTHPYTEYTDRGVGVAEMIHAMQAGKPHRASGELAYHILDVMHAFHDSSEEERHVILQSTCPKPEPLPAGLPPGAFA